ncbi:MAG: DedA family protein [Gemmataceae bacterium]|nr:DedA family protein [Gemmataceae bacterium]
MLERFSEYGYQGVFLALLASGLGFPLPEEIPVVVAGAMVGHEDTTLKWYVMLPVVIAGVVIGDGFLYGMGRLWGTRLLNLRWVQRRLITPEKRAEIEKNFHDRGIAVLLGARLLPGIRTPIFIMAGVLRVPVGRFLLADGLYAIPGVNLLFWLAYLLTDQLVEVVKKLEAYRPLVMVSILSAVAGALFQKYVLNRKVSTGEPPHVPPVIAKPAGAVAHAVEVAVEKVAHAAHLGRSGEKRLDPANGTPEVTDQGSSPPATSQPSRPAGA